MSGVASPNPKGDEQEQNDTTKGSCSSSFFILKARILAKKAKIVLNFTPPEANLFELFNFYT